MSLCQPAAVQNVQNTGLGSVGTAVLPTRILIVEDERILAKNMKTYLSRGSCDVRTAGDAAQALGMLESFSPDVLVLDFGLPDVDGLRTYAEIVRHQGRDIDCVLMTGNPTEQLAREARELGIQHIICKPFRFSELLRLLETLTTATYSEVS